MQGSRGEQDSLLEGLYESLITERLAADLRTLGHRTGVQGSVPEGDEPELLARHVRSAVSRPLSQERNAHQRRELVNALLRRLDAKDGLLPCPSRQLLAIADTPQPGKHSITQPTRDTSV